MLINVLFLQSRVTSCNFAAILYRNYVTSVSTYDRTDYHSAYFTNPLLATLTRNTFSLFWLWLRTASLLMHGRQILTYHSPYVHMSPLASSGDLDLKYTNSISLMTRVSSAPHV